MHDPTFNAAELAARRTAAEAVLRDFRADLASAPLTSPPNTLMWSMRLASALDGLLEIPAAPEVPPASYVRPDRSAELTPSDLMTALSALADGQMYRRNHPSDDDRRLAIRYGSLAYRLGMDA